MKNILFALFIFIFTSGITFYNFYRKSYVFAWITLIFAVIDLVILVVTIIKKINR